VIHFRDLPIRQKLLGAVAISVIPALVLSCVAFLAFEKHHRRSTVERELLATARIVASSSATSMRSGDRKGAEAALRALTANPGIRRAVLRDQRGEVFASYVQVNGARSADASPPSAAARDVGQAPVEVIHVIKFEGHDLGTVHLQAGMDDFAPDSAAFLVPMAAICAGSMLLVLLLMAWLGRAMTEPIRTLSNIAEDARAKGDTSRTRSEFLAGISHEMRTPLHAILSVAELGAKRAASLTPEKATRYYEMIEEGGRRLLEFLNDLVDLASLEEGKRALQFSSAPIEAVVVGVVEELRPVFQSRGVGLEVSPCQSTNGWIDRRALMQVLHYVLTSAAKWSGPGGTVTVALVRSGRGSILSVTDHGSGIVQEGRVFASESPNSGSSPGGMGSSEVKLAICRRIMAAHGGKIWTETRDGRGATVHLEIPDRNSPP
jgi:signal transduction histidine kinase